MAKKSESTGNFRELLTDIRKGNFAPIYVLQGEEAYYLDQLADAVEAYGVDDAGKDFDLQLMYGADIKDIEDIISAARQFPMMGSRRVVIAKELQSMSGFKNEMVKLEPYFKHPSPTTVLVLVYKGDAVFPTKTAKMVQQGGGILFDSPKIRDYQLSGPIKDYCTSKKIGIDAKALEMLVEYVGNDLSKLFGEIDKLIVASAGKIKSISAEVIERNIGISKDYNNFELTNALRSRDYGKALKIVEFFRRNPRQNPTVVTTATLYNFFSKLVIANFLKDKSDNAMMGALELKNAYALRDIKQGIANYNAYQSVKVIDYLLDFDCKSKGVQSFGNEYDLLQELVFKIATV
ncbi:MAG: DNA polymerase III subunit delta [Muribaculum sp.]|nr:DNA polymerase III subunit delta [Muribaculum sp.]